MKSVLAILRAKEFSPNAVDRDEAIMMAVVKQLRAQDCDVDVVNEDGPWSLTAGYDMVLTMGRRPETLSRLSAAGIRSINSSEAVAHCQRSRLSKIMREEGIPMPPETGSDGFWLKRGDVAGSMSDKDVMFAADANELKACKEEFRQRGIEDYVVCAHVKGYEVKFYGVLHADFFRSFSLSQQQSGVVPGLREAAERLAAAVGIEVYGGDCIVRQDGTFCIIDFNDWPSFSRCRDEAADAIARQLLKNKE